MIDPRPILVNEYEEAADASLRRACDRWNARVFPKVRVADAIGIESGAIEPALHRFALMAHFDFVVADEANRPQFAVEFDGPTHREDPKQIERDRKKDEICDLACLPLVRAGSRSLRKRGRWQLLEWLAEMWFIRRDLRNARWSEEDGDAWAEARAHYGLGGDEDEDDFNYQWTGLVRLGLHSFAFHDPFADARKEIAEFLWSRRWPLPHSIQACSTEGDDPVSGYVVVPIDEKTGLLGRGRCNLRRFWNFANVLPEMFAQDLALADAADQLGLYQRGELVPLSVEAIDCEIAGANVGALISIPTPSRSEMFGIHLKWAEQAGIDPTDFVLALSDRDYPAWHSEDDD